ncbi:hypothetical protein ACIRBX_19785 [Kitasatospora sp. NPDC096147]|uniref:hypothetical protein n=1 Tax=Kitasatospora sp. NPDC096147 TaxID=3364093 RepID=UPI0037FC4917
MPRADRRTGARTPARAETRTAARTAICHGCQGVFGKDELDHTLKVCEPCRTGFRQSMDEWLKRLVGLGALTESAEPRPAAPYRARP